VFCGSKGYSGNCEGLANYILFFLFDRRLRGLTGGSHAFLAGTFEGAFEATPGQACFT